MTIKRLFLLLLLPAVLLSACGKKDDPSAPLAFVPADTPYVAANLEPVPQKVANAWVDAFGQAGDILAAPIAMLEEASASVEDDKERRQIAALRALLEDLNSAENGWEETGLSTDARMAFYGVGITPVMRLELHDPEAFRDFVGKLEQAFETTLPVAEIDGQPYWHFAPDGNDRAEFVAAIVDSHLVTTVRFANDTHTLSELLGLTRPENTLQASERLQQANREFGFTPYGTGLVDNHLLFDHFIGLIDGQDQASIPPHLQTPACRDEFRALIDNVPSFVFGIDRFDSRHMDLNMIAALRPELTEALAELPAPVPGSAGDKESFLSIGFGINLDKLAEFIQSRVRTIQETPYQCAALAGLNNTGEIQQAMAGLHVTAGWFRGFYLDVDDLTWKDNRPEAIEATLMIASPNPGSLIGMVQAFAPPLAAIDLNLEGVPQALNLGEIQPALDDIGMDLPPAYIALGDEAIGLSLGQAAHENLAAQLTDAPAEPAPFLHYGFSGAAYALYMREIGNFLERDMADTLLDSEEDATPGTEAMIEQITSLYQTLGRMYEQIEYSQSDLLITDRGLELRQSTRLKQ